MKQKDRPPASYFGSFDSEPTQRSEVVTDNEITGIEIETLPDKVVYFAHLNSALDLSGCVIQTQYIDKYGNVSWICSSIEFEAYLMDETVFNTDVEEIHVPENELNLTKEDLQLFERVSYYYEVRHDVNFNAPGVYQVDIIRYNGYNREEFFTSGFTVEVIEVGNNSQ